MERYYRDISQIEYMELYIPMSYIEKKSFFRNVKRKHACAHEQIQIFQNKSAFRLLARSELITSKGTFTF